MKLRAERRAGEMLARMEKAKGAAKKGWKTVSHDATSLTKLGVSRTQSSRWQSIATLPKQDFEGYIREHRQGQKEITTAGAFKLFKAREESRLVQDSDSRLTSVRAYPEG